MNKNQSDRSQDTDIDRSKKSQVPGSGSGTKPSLLSKLNVFSIFNLTKEDEYVKYRESKDLFTHNTKLLYTKQR